MPDSKARVKRSAEGHSTWKLLAPPAVAGPQSAFSPSRADEWSAAAHRGRARAWLLEDLADALDRGLTAAWVWTSDPLPDTAREDVLAAGVAIGVIRAMAIAEKAAAQRLYERALEEIRRVL
jgi:hypothetical protein